MSDLMRGTLLKAYMAMQLPYEMIMQRVGPMKGRTDEEKEQIAVELLKEVESGELQKELDRWKATH